MLPLTEKPEAVEIPKKKEVYSYSPPRTPVLRLINYFACLRPRIAKTVAAFMRMMNAAKRT